MSSSYGDHNVPYPHINLSPLVNSLSGGELFERITAEGYTMSEAEVINYMRQICEGVKHMHEKNIIHLGECPAQDQGLLRGLWLLGACHLFFEASVTFCDKLLTQSLKPDLNHEVIIPKN